MWKQVRQKKRSTSPWPCSWSRPSRPRWFRRPCTRPRLWAWPSRWRGWRCRPRPGTRGRPCAPWSRSRHAATWCWARGSRWSCKRVSASSCRPRWATGEKFSCMIFCKDALFTFACHASIPKTSISSSTKFEKLVLRFINPTGILPPIWRLLAWRKGEGSDQEEKQSRHNRRLEKKKIPSMDRFHWCVTLIDKIWGIF